MADSKVRIDPYDGDRYIVTEHWGDGHKRAVAIFDTAGDASMFWELLCNYEDIKMALAQMPKSIAYTKLCFT